jgi:uncharacterized protein YggE
MKRSAILISILAFGMNALAAAERTISVSGQCLTQVAPDRGTVTLVSQFKDKSSQVASKKAMETYENVRKAALKLKLKDIELQTSEYTVQDDISYGPNGKATVHGKIAALGLQITTSEISRLGDVVALSGEFPIERVEGLRTFLSREKTKAAQESCLVEAIKNARGKAEKMSAAANAAVGDVQLIDENPETRVMSYSNAVSGEAQGKSMGSSLAPGIESRPETISVNILVKFALK